MENIEISQNEERLRQQTRRESNEMGETIRSLTKQRNELESCLNDYQQQINSIEAMRNEISDKNKVNIFGRFIN